MAAKKNAKKTEKSKIKRFSKKLKGRSPSNKNKESKVRKLIKLAKSKNKK